MRARHFEHYLSLQSQLAGFRRALREGVRREPESAEAGVVHEAKGWLAGRSKRRYKTAS